MIEFSKKGEKMTKGEEKMKRKWKENEMRKEKKNRKAKRKERKGKERRKKRIRREKMEEKEKGGKGKGRFPGFRAVDVRGLKLVHEVGSTCGHQKVGVSTNSKR